MTTRTFIREYDLTKISFSEIAQDIESKCNDHLFSQNSIKCMSNTQYENKYIVNVVYEYRIKWKEILIVLIFVFILLSFLFYLFNFLFKI